MAPTRRPDDDDLEGSEQFREDERAARIEVRRMLLQAVEKVTRKVETMEIAFAVMQNEWDDFKKLREEFRELEKSYSELGGHMKLQGRIFGWIAGLLLAIIAGLIVALFKKP